jgi:hypothetical protein
MFTKIQMDYHLTLTEAVAMQKRTAGITYLDSSKCFVSNV